jgi:hypothetical protein
LWFSAEATVRIITAWEYGNTILDRGQIAAGLEVLQAVVARRPGDVVKRKALREIEKSIVKSPTASAEGADLLLNDVWWEIHRAKHKRAAECIEWDAIDRAAERGLAVAPWDAELHIELGHACRARGYRDVARFAYQCALEIVPDRTDVREAMEGLAES